MIYYLNLTKTWLEIDQIWGNVVDWKPRFNLGTYNFDKENEFWKWFEGLGVTRNDLIDSICNEKGLKPLD